MVKFKGAGSSLRPADTSGVQRAHEGMMRTAQQGVEEGQQRASAIGGMIEQNEQLNLRKQQLQVEMAKSDLEFNEQGKVVHTAEGLAKQKSAAEAGKFKAETERKRAEADLINAQAQRMEIRRRLAEGITDTTERDKALQSLRSQSDKMVSTYEKVLAGDEAATNKVANEVQPALDMEQQITGGGGDSQPTGRGFGQPLTNISRMLKAYRAKIDQQQLQDVVDSGGEMADNIMYDSDTWQKFNSMKMFIKQQIAAQNIAMPPTTSVKERNKNLNKITAQAILAGYLSAPPDQMRPTAPGMPPGLQGVSPAMAPESQYTNPPPQGQGWEQNVPNPSPAAGPVPNPGTWENQP